MGWLFRNEDREPSPFDRAVEALGTAELVRLKSGGPVMTIRRIVDDVAAGYTGYPIGVHCTYFDEKGEFNEHCFHPHQLEPAVLWRKRQNPFSILLKEV